MKVIVKIQECDNVAVAVRDLIIGETVLIDKKEITIKEKIPAGHKMAVQDMDEGAVVLKYGMPIGYLKIAVCEGEWIHTHNLQTGLGDLLYYTYEPECSKESADSSEDIRETSSVTFKGFIREDASVGIRNDIWIIPTVGCVNSIAKMLATKVIPLKKESIDEIVAFTHPYGCSQMGEDQENTRKILADFIRHPNAGGVLLLGLGCENSGINEILQYLGDYNPSRVKFLVCQESEDEIEDGLRLLEELIAYASKMKRQSVDVKKLVVGLKCGGSDGFSGITANPIVGRVSDMLVNKGGTTILTEVPEMFGAEKLLMNRCKNKKIFHKMVLLINSFKQYFVDNHQTIYENPSPGNKEGGISTLEDKALGCTQKAGNSLVQDVLLYGERVSSHGLNLLSAPGNDLVAATALAASGAQLILFTTGRGTPFAAPVPTLKIASNTELATKKGNWIDYDAGVLLENTDIEMAGKELFSLIMEVASGKQVKSEKNGFYDMAIFKQGVTL